MDIKAARAVLAEVTRMYKAGKDGEDVLRLLELSEQMAKEHAVAVETLKAEGEKLRADNGIARDALMRAIAEAERVLSDARDDAAGTIAEAKKLASELHAKAEKALADALDETNAVNIARKEVLAGHAEACKELAAIEDKIEAAKKAMTNALKGL